MPRTLNFKLIFLLALIVISFSLRIYKLGLVPNGLATDEADIGYNAYSISKTGKDVYGRNFPIFFQSLDDYKPGIPIYSSVPAIYFFGLSDFSVRLAPAIIGSLTPILFFFLAALLFPENRKLPYIVSFMTVIAPWNIAISRAMIQYIDFVFFYLIFLILLLLGIKKNIKFLPLAFIALGITVYVYYASIIYLPLILIIFAVLYKDVFIKNLKVTFISLFALILITFPVIYNYASPKIRSRFTAISLFSTDITLPLSISESTYDQKYNIPFSNLVHNRRLIYLSGLLNNYVDYFNFDYMFINAQNARYFYVNYVGLFYILEAPLFLFGIYKLVKSREKTDFLILSLLLIGPLPAVITLGSPFPHRALLFIIAVQIISALGLSKVLDLSWKSYTHKSILIILSLIYAFNVYLFMHQYFFHSPLEFTSEVDNSAWFSTVRETVPKVNAEKSKYDKVVFTWASPKLVPPVYFLFYNKIDPKILQAKAAGWTNEPPSYRQIYNQIGNIEFRPINWSTDQYLKGTLFVGYPSEFPKDISKIGETKLPSGKTNFIFATNP